MKKIFFLILLSTTISLAQKKSSLSSTPSSLDTIVLAGGCYWCVEAVYENLKGVQKVVSGFAGGTVKNPSYEAVSSGATGAAEVVQITFNKKLAINRSITIRKDLGKKAILIEKSSDKIVHLLDHPIEEIYLNLRIKL